LVAAFRAAAAAIATVTAWLLYHPFVLVFPHDFHSCN
jgi:hypothetical protein